MLGPVLVLDARAFFAVGGNGYIETALAVDDFAGFLSCNVSNCLTEIIPFGAGPLVVSFGFVDVGGFDDATIEQNCSYCEWKPALLPDASDGAGDRDVPGVPRMSSEYLANNSLDIPAAPKLIFAYLGSV